MVQKITGPWYSVQTAWRYNIHLAGGAVLREVEDIGFTDPMQEKAERENYWAVRRGGVTYFLSWDSEEKHLSK